MHSKKEVLLARWALAMQEYDFTITYRKGQDNGNADALSRKTHTAATTQVQLCTDEFAASLIILLLSLFKQAFFVVVYTYSLIDIVTCLMDWCRLRALVICW